MVGPNGRGKTTLLKLLAGTLQPQQGDVSWHGNIRMGFFEQTNIASLVDTRTVEQEIMSADTQVDRQLARDICGAMMFEGDYALKKISVISGGEKSRVMLGKILATPVNLLVLDEPTNHLDMQSCDALIAALDNFDGAVIMVTHNELFLHALAERLVIFQNGRIDIFEGRYQEFLDRVGWQEEGWNETANSNEAAAPEQKFSKKEMRKQRSDIISERSRVLGPLEKKIAAAEAAIEACETELARASAAMQSASESGEALRIVELSKVISRCDADIDRLFDELSHDTPQPMT